MFECPGLSPGDARQLRVCQRTNLLLVEFNAVSCSSRSTMEAGLWTGHGYSAPWMYHSMAGQYTVLEKRLVPDGSSACRLRPGLRILQDSTNWPPPARWGPPRQDAYWFPGKELGRVCSSPKIPVQWSPIDDGVRCRRDLSWGSSPIAKESFAGRASSKWPQGPPKADPLSRAPPSYEDHLLLRLRAGDRGPPKENCPRPPPYVAPPAYEAPHRTVRRRETSTAKKCPPDAPQRVGRRAKRCHPRIPDGWSSLSGATTWAGARGLQECPGWWSWGPRRSHTLPKGGKGEPLPCHALPSGVAPQHTLPSGWGFSHAADPLGKRGKKAKGDPLQRSKGPSPSRGHTPQKPSGGLFVIDATCVVIQAHYIPPPHTQRVLYLGQEGAASKIKAATAPCSPARVSMEERAARILGLPMGDLGFPQAGEKVLVSPEIPGHSCPTGVAIPGSGPPGPGGLGSPQHSPRKPPLAPAASFQVGPTEPELVPDGRKMPIPCHRGLGCSPQGEAEPPVSAPSKTYVQDLKEAMLRIRRHTAPDSDTDEELEKEGEPNWCHSKAWKGHQNGGTLPYSNSSSSLESSGSNTTVVPGNAILALRKGPQSDSKLTPGTEVGQAVP